jgi:hypothetical protein
MELHIFLHPEQNISGTLKPSLMKTYTRILCLFILPCLFLACGRSSEMREQAALKATNDKALSDLISSSAAEEKNKDTTRKFIRTAQLKFKVKDLIRSSYQIEALTARFGGFVSYTALNSTIDNKSLVPVSPDSSLETISYTASNSITLRIPNTRLDSTLKSIALLVDYLDYRIIKADDVGLLIQANRITGKRIEKHNKRLTDAIDNRGKKLNETSAAEDHILSGQEQADKAMLDNLSLADQINFSTVNLIIYQRQASKHEMIANDQNITQYEPSFGSKVKEAFQSGWEMLKSFCLFLIHSWALIGIGILVYLGFKKYILPKK